MQLQFKGWKDNLQHISVALLYKLLIAPVLVTLVVLLSGVKGTIGQVSIFESAMPTLISSAIVAEEYGLNPKLSNLIIGIGILLCFITTGLWWLVLQWLM